MSSVQQIKNADDKSARAESESAVSDSPDNDGFLVPSPIPTRRTRTYSQSERAFAGPVHHGHIKSFCREKGHGFVIPRDSSAPIFVHVSDIEGELVPREGDEVSYKLCPMPPKFEKCCAVHVVIVKPCTDVPHDRWTETHHHHHPQSSPPLSSAAAADNSAS